MKLLVEANNLLSIVTGSFRDYTGMKARVKQGYEGEYTNHVNQYDALGYHLQDKSARYQLDGIRLDGMKVLDVGCGTGALAQVAFEKGSRGVVCGDIAAFMLKQAKQKGGNEGANHTFCQLDAEALPLKTMRLMP